MNFSPVGLEGVKVDIPEKVVGVMFGGLVHAWIGTIVDTGGESSPIEVRE